MVLSRDDGIKSCFRGIMRLNKFASRFSNFVYIYVICVCIKKRQISRPNVAGCRIYIDITILPCVKHNDLIYAQLRHSF